MRVDEPNPSSQVDLRDLGGGRKRGLGHRFGLIPVYTTLPPKGSGGEIAATVTVAGVYAYYAWTGSAWSGFPAVGGSTHEIISATHTDTSGSPASGNFLRYNGANWVPADIVDGDVPATIMRDAEHTALGDGSPHHAAVTLAGAPDYLTLAGQVITRGLIDLTADVTGDLPLAEGGTGASLADPDDDRVMFWDDSAGAVVFCDLGVGLTSDATPTIKVNTAVLYSVHQYVFTPDAGPQADVETGAHQGMIHVSGPSTETVKRITGIAETAAGTAFTFTLDYDSGNDDFDTFVVDTEIDEVAMGTAKGVVVSAGFTNSSIVAQSLISLDVTTVTGSAPKDVTIILEVWRPLQT